MQKEKEYVLVFCPEKKEAGFHTNWANPKDCLKCEKARILVNKTKQGEIILKCAKKVLEEPILVGV